MISHDGLTITRITPEPVPNPLEPQLEDQHWVALDPENRGGTRLADLLAAFNQMKVPVADQIKIIKAIHKLGKLHGELIIE
jgi:hypothetical protein